MRRAALDRKMALAGGCLVCEGALRKQAFFPCGGKRAAPSRRRRRPVCSPQRAAEGGFSSIFQALLEGVPGTFLDVRSLARSDSFHVRAPFCVSGSLQLRFLRQAVSAALDRKPTMNVKVLFPE